MKKIFACDLGGTNVRFGSFVFEADSNDSSLKLKKTKSFKTAEFSSFQALLDAAKSFYEADLYSFAVPGPVFNASSCKPPNIPWSIETTKIDENIVLLNDFEAQAWELTERYHKKTAPIAVVGAGTGFGKALVVNFSGKPHVIASEGGHSYFPFMKEWEHNYASFVSKRLSVDSLTCDCIVSGRGLELLHEFIHGVFLPAERIDLKDESSEVFAKFATMYGRVCRNFVLETFAIGGLVVGGGIAIKNPELILSQIFKKSFCGEDGADYGYILERVPIEVLTSEDGGLLGAARYSCSSLSS